MVKLIGIPFDKKSSFLQGPALAPARIRQVLHNGSSNYWTEKLQNPIEHPDFSDGGDLTVEHYEDIEKELRQVLKPGVKLLSLGGDHSVTYPLIKVYKEVYGSFDILHIDAHGDLYQAFEGDPHSHACPFARIMEEGLVNRLVQVGVRTLNPHQLEQARRFGVEQITMLDFEEKWRSLEFNRPLYISMDLDGLDPAFAPGVSHHEPGGLSTRQVLDLFHRVEAELIGADIVEYNPHRDVSDMTAAVAAKLLKELAAKMV